VTIVAIYLRERRMGDKRRTKETRTIKGLVFLASIAALSSFIALVSINNVVVLDVSFDLSPAWTLFP
jgi:hypothetical protein